VETALRRHPDLAQRVDFLTDSEFGVWLFAAQDLSDV
jgi:hypothetical protein